MQLYISKFVEISLSDSNLIIINDWFDTTMEMTDEQYQNEMLKFAELAVLHNPKYHLIKSINFLYAISLEMQDWTNNTIFPQLQEAGIKKIAFLVSAELIAQLSIEQTLEESNASAFEVKYFDVEDDAKNWLLG